MSERERIDRLNELFFDYISYLAFMARQILGHGSRYGHFSLIKALEKVLEIQEVSEEMGHDEFCDRLRAELESVQGTSSGDLATWEPFLDRLTMLFTQEMKTMQNS